MNHNNKGIWFGVGCYLIWGFFPAYWKLLHAVPALQIVAHRLVWSLVFLVVVVSLRGQWNGFRRAFDRRTLLIYTIAACILTVNWLIYIWGVNAGFVLETSLGYYINPLVNVLFGVLFFHERLSTSRWLAIGLATTGVFYLTISYGQVPWIALALAFSFGIYGLVKKLSPLPSLEGLTIETGVMLAPGLVYLLLMESQGTGSFGHVSALANILLILAGPVTAIPLLLFASAARSIPLSMIGLLQYIAPTMQFLLGVFAYGEPFTHERLIGFGIIWAALALLYVGGIYERKKALAVA